MPSPPVAAGTVNAVMALFCFQLLAETLDMPKVGIRSAATVQVKLSVSVSLSLSLTVTVAVPMPAAVGVPETERDAFIDTPEGRPLAE